MNTLRVALFLAIRQIRRSNPWTTLLIVFIMTLTFLNLVVVSGILVGLPEGARASYSRQYSGEVLIRPLLTKQVIEQSQLMISTLREMPEVAGISPRYTASAIAESNYRTNIGPGKKPDTITTIVSGIDPLLESTVTDMGEMMLQGEPLHDGEEGFVLLGKNLVEQYTVDGGQISALVLRDVSIGDKIRLTVSGNTNEYIVKGIVSGKISEVSTRIFMNDKELRRILGRSDQNVGEIAVRLTQGADAREVVRALKALGYGAYARIETSRQSQGTFLDDIAVTFSVLSNVIGGIGIMVASITVFIVIFINAVTRRKYIGILKGIGVTSATLELSYVLQSLFYGIVGSSIGIAIIYYLLKPYFDLHPINFPFADGMLLVPLDGTILRAAVLLGITLVAGFVPARMIVKQNTLDAILGR